MTPTLTLLALALVTPRAPAALLKGPYFQNGTPGAMVGCWQTDAPANGEVRYGPTSSYGLVQATAGTADLQAVRLTGLLPGMVSYYQVAARGETSRIASFATAPQPEQPFTFVVVGDTRTDADAHQSVVDRVLATVGAPDLCFNTGDLVEEGTLADQWTEFFGTCLAGLPRFRSSVSAITGIPSGALASGVFRGRGRGRPSPGRAAPLGMPIIVNGRDRRASERT